MNTLCESLANRFSFPFQSTSSKQACAGLLRDYATRQRNAFLWISLIAVTALLLEKLFRLFNLWSKGSRLPGPPCSSFFGHGNFGSRENFIDFLSESHEKYGLLVKLWLGPTQLLVSLTDPALIQEMLKNAEDKLPFTGKAFRLAFGRSSLFFCSYNEAKQRRESLASELNKKLIERENIIPDCIMEKVDELVAKGSTDRKMVSQHIAFIILGTALLGNAFLQWSKATLFEELLMMTAKDAAFWASYRVTPFWKYEFWDFHSLCTKLKCLTQDVVQFCRRDYKAFSHKDQNLFSESAKVGKKAAIELTSGFVFQDKFYSQELDGHLSEEQYANILGLMFHGSVAMSGLIDSIFNRLVTDPELQDKIYLEISMGKQHSGENQNVDKMQLLLATIYESARLLPTGPLLQRCSFKNDLCLKDGIMIPAGTVLVVPLQLLQMDNSIWGSNANKFNPYRFLAKFRKASDLVKHTQFTDARDSLPSSLLLKDPNETAAFLPFGSGIRACVAQNFVIHGVAAFFASLLGCYEVRNHPGCGNDPKATMKPQIVFTRRNS